MQRGLQDGMGGVLISRETHRRRAVDAWTLGHWDIWGEGRSYLGSYERSLDREVRASTHTHVGWANRYGAPFLSDCVRCEMYLVRVMRLISGNQMIDPLGKQKLTLPRSHRSLSHQSLTHASCSRARVKRTTRSHRSPSHFAQLAACPSTHSVVLIVVWQPACGVA